MICDVKLSLHRLTGVLSRPAGGSYSSYLIHWCDLRYATLRSPPDCPAGVLSRPRGGSYSSYLDHWCDLHCVAVAAGLPCGRPFPPWGRASLILFQSQVRSRSASPTSATLRSPPDCSTSVLSRLTGVFVHPTGVFVRPTRV